MRECPECGVTIIYGYPTPECMNDLFEAGERGDLVVAGRSWAGRASCGAPVHRLDKTKRTYM